MRRSLESSVAVFEGYSAMCGIVAAVSSRSIVPILIEGLRRLEYRGYDSCGVALHQDGELRRARSTARVAELGGQRRDRPPARRHRHRPHPLGDARRAGGEQRPSALLARAAGRRSTSPAKPPASPQRSGRPGAQRDHREPRRAARRAAGSRLRLRHPDRHRGHRPPRRPTSLRRRPARRRCSAPCRGCAAPSPSPCSAATSRTAWSARARARRSILGVGHSHRREREPSSPPTRWRSPASPTRSSTSRKATSPTSSSASTGSSMRTQAAPGATSRGR